MTITLTPKESEDYFYNALCNAGGYIQAHGVELDWNEEDYIRAKNNWITAKGDMQPCIEDVWMQILRDGKALTLKDVEGDGEYTRSITLKHVHERVQKTPIRHLQDMINENDDATTADVILQTVFLEEVVFG